MIYVFYADRLHVTCNNYKELRQLVSPAEPEIYNGCLICFIYAEDGRYTPTC